MTAAQGETHGFDDFRSTQSPKALERLPSELLTMVFIEYRNMFANTNEVMRIPLILSHVNKSWRRILLSTQALWSHITISFEGLPFSLPQHVRKDMLDAFITRSGRSLLSIRFVFPLHETASDFADNIHQLQSLELHADRIEEINILCANIFDTGSCLDKYLRGLHALVRFKVQCPWIVQTLQAGYEPFTSAILATSPALRIIEMSCGVPILLNQQVQSITHLTLSGYRVQASNDQMFKPLEYLCNLETLVLMGDIIPQDREEIPGVTLPALQRLHIMLGTNELPLLEYLPVVCLALTAPALRSFVLDFEQDDLIRDLITWRGALSGRYPNLEFLELPRIKTPAKRARMLMRALPTITHLSLNTPPEDEDDLPYEDGTASEALEDDYDNWDCDDHHDGCECVARKPHILSSATHPVDGAGILWPELHTLTIYERAVDKRWLKDFITYRKEGGFPIQKIRLNTSSWWKTRYIGPHSQSNEDTAWLVEQGLKIERVHLPPYDWGSFD